MADIDIRSALAGLRRLPAEAQAGAIPALAGLAEDLTGELQATDVHGDVTGATRASYRAYVVHEADDGSNAAGEGAAAAEALNPGHGVVARTGSIGDDVILVASVFTDYAEHLATDEAGARDAVGPLITRVGEAAAREAAAGIRRRLGG
ncbi:MAG TPA: hypothetical protein PKD53_04765 [Chloroflexaceae bacterium]|nr:hypothetical protein [Chloroflexaceae bacterium]